MRWYEQFQWPSYWYALRNYQGVPLVNKFLRWIWGASLSQGISGWLEQFEWEDVT